MGGREGEKEEEAKIKERVREEERRWLTQSGSVPDKLSSVNVEEGSIRREGDVASGEEGRVGVGDESSSEVDEGGDRVVEEDGVVLVEENDGVRAEGRKKR